MSIECSECERELRGGHARECSRWRACECGHELAEHDEEFDICDAPECDCLGFHPAEIDVK